MTEAEALTTKCCGPPAVAAAVYYRAGAAVDAPMHCIGPACAAWRWTFSPEDIARFAARAATGSDLPTEAEGYCGLAGRP